MTRYIDADALKTRWYKINDIDENDRGARFVGYTEITRLIDKTPTADVVEVVRCKDCRHADECHKSVQYTRNEPNSVTIGYSQIEWCSRGERKEESEVKE